MERTLVILKPDAINRDLTGELLSRFEKKGLKIVALKMEKLHETKLREHYAHLAEKAFFAELIAFMSSIPSVLVVLEGKDVVNVVRRMCGPTLGREALPGTIRGDYSMSTQANVVHASETPEIAQSEIRRFFAPAEIMDYAKFNFNAIYSETEKGMNQKG